MYNICVDKSRLYKYVNISFFLTDSQGEAWMHYTLLQIIVLMQCSAVGFFPQHAAPHMTKSIRKKKEETTPPPQRTEIKCMRRNVS